MRQRKNYLHCLTREGQMSDKYTEESLGQLFKTVKSEELNFGHAVITEVQKETGSEMDSKKGPVVVYLLRVVGVVSVTLLVGFGVMLYLNQQKEQEMVLEQYALYMIEDADSYNDDIYEYGNEAQEVVDVDADIVELYLYE